jgi:micrococcal nuclease
MRAKQALAEMTFGKTISVFTTTRDRYGRVIGHITAEGIDVNAELVRLGYAWVYRRYSNDAELLRLEEAARAEKLGLWAQSNPIPPWEWRRGRRPSSDSLATSPTGMLSGAVSPAPFSRGKK